MGPIVLLVLIAIIGGAAGIFSALMVGSLRGRIERLEREMRARPSEQPPEPPAQESMPRHVPPPPQGPPLPTPIAPPVQEWMPAPVPPPVAPAAYAAPRSAEHSEGAPGDWPVTAPPPWTRSPAFPPRERSPEETLRARQSWNAFEEALGRRWTTWVGAIVLFLGAGFFVKYAFDHQWLDPPKRVILAVVFGIVLAGVGVRFDRRAMRVLGQGLIGTGLAVIYVALYAAFAYYQIMSRPVAFALMAVVTAGGMTLACVLDAVAISFLAVLGGFVTPILLRTGGDARDTLFAYILVLDLGVLVVAVFKRWRALDVLAFVGTWALFSLWYFGLPGRAAVVPTMLWLGVFYVVFLLQPVVNPWRTRTQMAGERFVLAMVHATIVFSFAYGILYYQPNAASGSVSLAMGFCYVVFAVVTRLRTSADRRAVFGFIALAIIFLTLAAPIFFDFYPVTIAWAIEGAALVYLGYRFTHPLPRLGGVVVLVLAAGRFFAVHWPLHAAAFTPVFNPAFGSAMLVALAGAASALIHHGYRRDASETDHALKLVSAIGAGLFALLMVHVEVAQYLGFADRSAAAMWAGALVWIAGATAYLGLGFALRSTPARVTAMVAFGVSLFLVVLDYGLGVKLGGGIVFNGRYAASVCGGLVLFGYAYVTRRAPAICTVGERQATSALCGSAIVLLAILTSFEVVFWLTGPGQLYWARCLVALIWVAASMALLYVGFVLRSARSRVTAIVALGVSLFLIVLDYGLGARLGGGIVFNGRYAASVLIGVVLFAYAFVTQRAPAMCTASEQRAPTFLYGSAIVLLAILTSFEVVFWLTSPGQPYWARCLVTLIWVGASMALLYAGARFASLPLCASGTVVLVVAAIAAIAGYGHEMAGAYVLGVNGRFLTALTIVLALFVHAAARRGLRAALATMSPAEPAGYTRTAVVALLLLLSVETQIYFATVVHTGVWARGLAQMALTVLWGVFASALLAAGFVWKDRVLRFMALGLFGLACLKLIAIDMANVRDVYRIISSFVLGLLIIGASYLYHRIEKRIA